MADNKKHKHILRPLEQEIHIWIAEAANFKNLEHEKVHLSQKEKRRFLEFHFEADKFRFLLSRYALTNIILKYFPHLEMKNLNFTKTAFGKPRLSILDPQKNLYFNLSHSNENVAIAFSSSFEIGVDIEVKNVELNFNQIAEETFSDRELWMLSRLELDKVTDYFYKIWTLKEAFAKAKGLGFSIPFKSFSIEVLEGQNAAVKFAHYADDKFEKCKLKTFKLGGETWLSLAAVTDKPIKIKFFKFR